MKTTYFFVRIFVSFVLFTFLFLFTDNEVLAQSCGNGIVEAGETCDDIITTDGNGCDSSCQIESNYSCEGSPSVCNYESWITKKMGGINDLKTQGGAVDSNGNIYMIGSFLGTLDIEGTILTSNGKDDGFIAKYDSGNNLIWVKKLGYGGEIIRPMDVVISVDGYIYSIGYYYGYSNKPANFGTTVLTAPGWLDRNIFVTKQDLDGNFLWAKKFGNDSNYSDEYGASIVTDTLGNIYIGGSIDDPTLFGSITLSPSVQDAFIVKLNSNGDVLWANLMIGNSLLLKELTIDLINNKLYSVGEFWNTVSIGGKTINAPGGAGDWGSFLFQQNLDGTTNWGLSLGSNSSSKGYNVITNLQGDIFVSGVFQDNIIFGDTSFIGNGLVSSYLLKLDSNGNHIWATQFGGGNELGNEDRHPLFLDGSNIYIAGFFNGNGVFGNKTLVSEGIYSDIFISKLSQAEGSIFRTKQIGSTNRSRPTKIFLGPNNLLMLIGYFNGDSTFGGSAFLGDGGFDGFFTEIDIDIPSKVYNIYFEGYKGTDFPVLEKNIPIKLYITANNWLSTILPKTIFNGFGNIVDFDISQGESINKEMNMIPFKARDGFYN